MFNAGIIATIRAPLVRITDRYLAQGASFSEVDFWDDGRATYQYYTAIPGEWWVAGKQSAGLSAPYQFRMSVVAGISPIQSTSSDLKNGVWTSLPAGGQRRVIWDQGAKGRVLVEIREIATGKILASARYWSDPTMAP